MSVTFDEHVRAFLSEPLAAVLATVSPRRRPQATPVWFMLDDGLILINTSRGRVKLRNRSYAAGMITSFRDGATGVSRAGWCP